MISFSPEAAQQVRALREYYEGRERVAAVRALILALEVAWRKISANHTVGLAAPRPYPQLAKPGRAWIKSGRYWIAYTTAKPTIIVGVFYDTADIATRA